MTKRRLVRAVAVVVAVALAVRVFLRRWRRVVVIELNTSDSPSDD